MSQKDERVPHDCFWELIHLNQWIHYLAMFSRIIFSSYRNIIFQIWRANIKVFAPSPGLNNPTGLIALSKKKLLWSNKISSHVAIFFSCRFDSIFIQKQVPNERVQHMMMSSNGNIFRVTGHLCGEFTDPRWIPLTKARDEELWCFLW